MVISSDEKNSDVPAVISSDEKNADVPAVVNSWCREKFQASTGWNRKVSSTAAATRPVSSPYSFVKMIDIGSADAKQQFRIPLVIGVDCRRRPVIIASLMTELVHDLNVQLKGAGVQLRKTSIRAQRRGVPDPIQYMLSFEELERVAPGSAARVLDEMLQWMNIHWSPEHIRSFQEDGYLEFNLGSWVHSGNPHVKLYLHEDLYGTVCQHVFEWNHSPLQVHHEAFLAETPSTQNVYGVSCQAYSIESKRLHVVVPEVPGSLTDQLGSLLTVLKEMKDNGFKGGCCFAFLPDQQGAPRNAPIGVGFELCAYLRLPTGKLFSKKNLPTCHPGMDGAAVR